MLTVLRVIIATLLVASTAAHALEPVPFSAEYRATFKKGLPINGTASRTLSKAKADGEWVMTSDVNSFIADINEKAHFRWVEDTAIAETYRYELTGWALKDRRVTANFDWEAKKVSGEGKRGNYSYDTLPGMLDDLTYQLQLSMDLRAGKQEVIYEVVDDGKRRTYHFKVMGEDRLPTAAGEIRTILVEKIRDKDSGRQTRLWFAPEWEYALVKLMQTEPDGQTYELHLDKLQLPDRTIDP